ncbi:MAG: molybdenum cofactor guanylyltransferase [Chloroflexi bacterium]|nr:molybdenum cofactor guanylyltransferase [Chloroflexota bacterium]
MADPGHITDEQLRRTLTGVVLVGGTSRRMGGGPKPLLMVGNKLLLARVADALQPICSELIAVVRPGQDDPVPETAHALQMHIIQDEEHDGGPLAGMCAGLGAAVTPLCFLTGADHPFLSRTLIRAMNGLALQNPRQPIAVVPRVEGRLQPLHAVYPTRAWLEATRSALSAGERSPTRMLEGLLKSQLPPVRILGEDEIVTYDPQMHSLFDVDTPSQLERARRIESWVTSIRPGMRPPGGA